MTEQGPLATTAEALPAHEILAASGALVGLAEGLRIETSERGCSYLLVADNGVHIKLSERAFILLRGLADGESVESVAARLGRAHGHEISIEDTVTACEDVARRVATLAACKRERLPRFFWLRVRFLSSAVVEQVVAPLTPLFTRRAAAFLLSFTALGLGFALREGLRLDIANRSFLAAYGLFLFSLVLHELGHATACARFGARPSDIGFTMYLIYPAFYSDVTASWRLPRLHRVIVDLGGIYFQLAVGSCYVLLYRVTGWEPLWLAFAMIIYGTLFSLNPIFKFDGYWLLADALGVPNLAQQPGRFFRRLRDRLLGRPVKPWPWPPGVIVALGIYSLLSVMVWFFFIWLLMPYLQERLFLYPQQMGSLAAALMEPGLPTAELVLDVVSTTMLALLASLLLVRITAKLLGPMGSWVARHLSDRSKNGPIRAVTGS